MQNCHAIYQKDELKNNIDGTCDWCGYPLEALQKENDSVLHDMIGLLKECDTKRVWDNIELIKDAKDRVKERHLFFQALKRLNKNFSM